MKREDFRAKAAGRIVRSPEGYDAFVPAKLPPKIEYDPHLVMILSKADTAFSELAGIGRSLPNPHFLISPYLRQEAVLSSRIEGTQTNLAELLQDELENKSLLHPGGDIREVRNYVMALEYGINLARTLPLSLRLVKEIHSKLMDGVRGENASPGEFRRSQNWVGPKGCTAQEAIFVPPPVQEMQQCLYEWEEFLHHSQDIPDLIACALIHQQFETIHPFSDGNGRIGRLLNTLFLMARGRLPQPLLYLSAYFEANRQDYYLLLQNVRTQGDWQSWIRFFLRGVTQISKQAVKQAGKLIDQREEYRKRLLDSPNALRLLEELFLNPYINVARAEEILSVSNPTARQVINKMVECGLLAEVSGRSWNKFYLARPIFEIFEDLEIIES